MVSSGQLNILLDANEDIKLGDFDATVKPGTELIVASEPFCKINKDFEPPLAGPVSEQFSLASCIYDLKGTFLRELTSNATNTITATQHSLHIHSPDSALPSKRTPIHTILLVAAAAVATAAASTIFKPRFSG